MARWRTESAQRRRILRDCDEPDIRQGHSRWIIPFAGSMHNPDDVTTTDRRQFHRCPQPIPLQVRCTKRSWFPRGREGPRHGRKRMPRMRSLRSLAVVLIALLPLTTAAADGSGWYHSFEDAREAARERDVPLLLHFHAWYCGPCRQMDRQVFSHPEIQYSLRDEIAAVEIDVTRENEIAAQYGASTVPRDVIVYQDGSIETVNVGGLTRNAYMRLLSDVAVRGVQLRNAAPLVVESDESNSTGAGAAELPGVVGLNGYCPVHLSRDRKWVKGRNELSDTYREITYFFPDVASLQEFRKQPSRYAPQNLGCDPVVLLSKQQAVPGDIRHGAFFDGHLYLFQTLENRKLFKADPIKFTRIRHAIRVDQIEGRRFQ